MMFETGKDAKRSFKRKRPYAGFDTGMIEMAVVVKAIGPRIPAARRRFKAGETKSSGALVGAVMKETGGKANPKVVNEILQKKLQG
jgi:aspartyl-tRNA(Asn)/glutamyl-tRNA(Gln) amidotransferase subunit B